MEMTDHDMQPYAENPHTRFDEGNVALAETPRRGSLLYRKVNRRMSFPFRALGRGMMICATALAIVSAFAADVEWPSDFNEKLAAHIADEKSTNTTFEVYSM